MTDRETDRHYHSKCRATLCSQQKPKPRRNVIVDSCCFVWTVWTTSVCRCTLTSSLTATCGVLAGTCGRRRRRRQRPAVTPPQHCEVRHCRLSTKDASRQTRASTSTTTTTSISRGLHHQLTTSRTSPCLASQLEHRQARTSTQYIVHY